MEALSLALTIVAILIAVYYYVLKTDDVFKKHGIPRVESKPVVGNFGPLLFRKTSFPDLLKQIYYTYPEARYVGLYEFTRPLIMLRDLDLIKSVTTKNFESFPDHRPFADPDTDPLLGNMLFFLKGEIWKEKRSVLSPTFTSSKIKSMFSLMTKCAIYFADCLSKLPENKRETELKSLLTMYTNDVIASCAFGVNVDSMADPNNPFYVHGRKATNLATAIAGLKFMIFRNAPWLSKILNISFVAKDSSDFFSNVISSTVKARDKQGLSRSDFIQLMMERRKKKENGKDFTDQDIIINAFSFFFGGFDTVASQSCFVLHYLAVNPDVQEKLQSEINQVIEDTQGEVTYDAIMGMEYLDAVVTETMRIVPIASFLDRMCTKSFELPPALPGGKPFVVQPGMNLWIPVHAIHHDPNYYEDPEAFKPERFLRDGKVIVNSSAYFPFGLGPRMCIGNRFALAKMKVLVFHLLSRCNVKPCSKTSIPLKLGKGLLNIAPENGFWVKIEPRKDPPPVVHSPMINGTCKTEN